MLTKKILFFVSLFLCGLNNIEAQNIQQPQTSATKFSSSRVAEFWQQIEDIINDPNFSSSN
jgi:hypothetical protein